MDYSIIQNISYFISASSILTDWSCAILPCIIVWNLNMKRKLKVSAAGILALGAVASLSTIVRLPYLGAYTAPKDHYCKPDDLHYLPPTPTDMLMCLPTNQIRSPTSSSGPR